MREAVIEAYLVKQVAVLGLVAEKFSSPNRRFVPDRIIPVRQGYVEFVEVKAPGQKPTPGQLRDHERRRAQGFVVEVVDSYEEVDFYIAGLCYRMRQRGWL